jgi:hypothetical protein
MNNKLTNRLIPTFVCVITLLQCPSGQASAMPDEQARFIQAMADSQSTATAPDDRGQCKCPGLEHEACCCSSTGQKKRKTEKLGAVLPEILWGNHAPEN